MTDTATPTDTRTDYQLDQGDHDRFAHFAFTPGEDGEAVILEEKVPADGTAGHYMYLRTESDGTVLPMLHLGDRVEMNSDDPMCSPWNGYVGRVSLIDHTLKYPYGVALDGDLRRYVRREEIIKVNTVAL